MKPNRLRELLNAGKPTLGTHVISPWPGVVEVIGHSGEFDYIEFVGEYAPFSLEQLDNFGRAIELFPKMSAMMKVDEPNRAFIAQRAIDAGIQNVLFVDVRTADDVRECIRAVRPETPEDKGRHGCSMRRNVGYVLEPGSQAWVDAMNEVVVAVMIEKKDAVDNIEDILEVEGLDMIQFGPADLSVTLGIPGQMQAPEVKEIERHVIELAIKKGVAPRVEFGQVDSMDQIKPYLDMGVSHFCMMHDVSMIYNWCKYQGPKVRGFLQEHNE